MSILSETRKTLYKESVKRDKEDLKVLIGIMNDGLSKLTLDRATLIVRSVIRTQRIIDTKLSLI